MSDLFKIASPVGEPRTSVLLVHGLGGHHYDTWRCGADRKPWNTDETFWPLWLARDCETLAVYVIGYDAPVSRLRGTAMHLTDQATSILARLLAEPALARGPLIFIGHSLGGLIIKQLLRTAESTARFDPRAGNLIERVGKVAFLATPHSGAGLASWGDRLRILVRPSAAMACLVRNDPNLRDLNNWYREWANDRGIAHLILAETKPALILGMLVPPDSADPGLANVRSLPIGADHIGICKPADHTKDIYVLVRDFITRPVQRPKLLPDVVGQVRKCLMLLTEIDGANTGIIVRGSSSSGPLAKMLTDTYNHVCDTCQRRRLGTEPADSYFDAICADPDIKTVCSKKWLLGETLDDYRKRLNGVSPMPLDHDELELLIRRSVIQPNCTPLELQTAVRQAIESAKRIL